MRSSWADAIGRSTILRPGELPYVSPEEAVRRMDLNRDGFVSDKEREYARDNFAPGKRNDHAIAIERIGERGLALKDAKKKLADVTYFRPWVKGASLATTIGSGLVSAVIAAAKFAPLAMLGGPALPVIASILGGIALLLQIVQFFMNRRIDSEKSEVASAQQSYERAWQEFGATLPRPEITNPKSVPDAAPKLAAPVASGVGLRRPAAPAAPRKDAA